MDIKITPRPLRGTVGAITSKSAAHRLLICSAFADEQNELVIDDLSNDINATINCLTAMGADIKRTQKEEDNCTGFLVNPVRLADVKSNALLECNASGTTLRLLLPLAAAAGKNLRATGTERLPERPMKELINVLEENGACFSSRMMPYTVGGRLKNGRFCLPGNVSSGYVSGLMLALPLLSGDSEIVLRSPLESESYVNMTLKTLKLFGVKIEKSPENKNSYLIKGGQIYKSPVFTETEKDWSNAAFFLAAGALGDGICVKGLDINSAQGDKKIIDILKDFGASVTVNEAAGEITVSGGSLKGVEADVSDIPDLLPVLAVTGAFAEGKTVLYNAARLRIKECDRLSVMANLLNSFGFYAEEESDKLIITGNKTKKIVGEIITDSFNDHRVVMSAAVLSFAAKHGVLIKNAEAVRKSYPAFFEDFNKLGGSANVV